MRAAFEIAKDIFAVIGLAAVIWKIWAEIGYHNWLKNNW